MNPSVLSRFTKYEAAGNARMVLWFGFAFSEPLASARIRGYRLSVEDF